MIYSIYFSGLIVGQVPAYGINGARGGIKFDAFKLLAEKIRNSSQDSFVFILTNNNNGMYTRFEDWVAKNKLEGYIAFEPKRGITNPGYPSYTRNLRLVIMASQDHEYRYEMIECMTKKEEVVV